MHVKQQTFETLLYKSTFVIYPDTEIYVKQRAFEILPYKRVISYCINTTKYWLHAIFEENELVSSL